MLPLKKNFFLKPLNTLPLQTAKQDFIICVSGFASHGLLNEHLDVGEGCVWSLDPCVLTMAPRSASFLLIIFCFMYRLAPCIYAYAYDLLKI